MIPERGARSRRVSRRRLIAYALSVAIFVGALILAIKLSYPPDTYGRRHGRHSQTERVLQVGASGNELTVRTDRGERRYRLYRSREGIVAREVTGGEDEAGGR